MNRLDCYTRNKGVSLIQRWTETSEVNMSVGQLHSSTGGIGDLPWVSARFGWLKQMMLYSNDQFCLVRESWRGLKLH